MAEKKIETVVAEALNNEDALVRIGKAVRAALPEGAGLTWNVGGLTPLALGLAEVSDGNLGYCIIHALKQRVGDASALGSTWNKKLGRVPTLEDKRDAMERIIRQLKTDSWDATRVVAPRVDETMEFLVRALTGYVDSTGATWDAAKARTMLEEKGAAGRSQIATDRKLPTWKYVEAQMAKETKAVDTKKLMEGF